MRVRQVAILFSIFVESIFAGSELIGKLLEDQFPKTQECILLKLESNRDFGDALSHYTYQKISPLGLESTQSWIVPKIMSKCAILWSNQWPKEEIIQSLRNLAQLSQITFQLVVTAPKLNVQNQSVLESVLPFEAHIFAASKGQISHYHSCPEDKLKPVLTGIHREDGENHVKIPTCRPYEALRGERLNVTAFGVSPFVIFNGRTIRGVDFEILTVLARKYGFTFQIEWGGHFGARNPDTGKWDGVTGQVASGAYQLGIGAIIATDSDRNTAVDFLDQIYPMEFFLIAPTPQIVDPYLNILKPFDIPSWALLLGSIFIIGFLCYGIVQLSVDLKAAKHEKSHNISLFMVPFRSITGQDSGFHVEVLMSHSLTLKLLLGFWFVYALIVKAAFGGNLNSFLIAQDYEPGVNTEQDIIDQGRNFYLPLTGSLKASVETSPLDIHKKLMQVTSDGDGFYPIVRGWLPTEFEEAMMKTKAVLLYPRDPVIMRNDFLEQKYGPRPLRIGRKPIFTFSSSFMVGEEFPFKEDFNRILGRAKSMGLFEKFKTQFFSQRALITDGVSAEFVKLTFDHILGPVIILGGGLALSLICFFIEVCGRPGRVDLK